MSLTGPAVVYMLCLLTSGVCAFLLARAWRATAMRLLLWAAVCFGLLAVNNLFLFLDLVVFPDAQLLWARQISQLAAICVLLYAFIWEAE